MSKESYISDAIDWVNKRSATSLKANFDGFEKPKAFLNKSSDEEVRPDISFIGQGGEKNYTEIAVKEKKQQKLVTRWKLLSMMASIKRGKLFLLAPRGHKMFVEKLVRKYHINAFIYSI